MQKSENMKDTIYLFDQKKIKEIIERLGTKINRCIICNHKLKMKHLGTILQSEKDDQISFICNNPICSLELRNKEVLDAKK